MAYRVEYEDVCIKKLKGLRRVRFSNNKIFKRVAVICFVAVLAVFAYLTDALIPGNAAITRVAADEFLQNLRSGEQVADAFAVFCQTVLENG